MINFLTNKPFTGRRLQVAALLCSQFGYQEIGIKREHTKDGSSWWNIYAGRFRIRKDTKAEKAVNQLLAVIDPDSMGCDVWVD